MTSKSLTLMFVGALLTGLAAQSWGQADDTAKTAAASDSAGYDRIGTIDFTRVYLECAQARDLSEIIRTREGEVQVEVRDRQRVMDEKQAAIGAFRVGTPDYEARRKELMRLGIESNVWIKMLEQDMEAQKFDWTRALYEQAQAIVEEISKERGLTMVLQTREFQPQEMNSDVAVIRRYIQERVVAYARPTSDITQEVIGRLDAKYKAAGGKKLLSPSPTAAPTTSKP